MKKIIGIIIFVSIVSALSIAGGIVSRSIDNTQEQYDAFFANIEEREYEDREMKSFLLVKKALNYPSSYRSNGEMEHTLVVDGEEEIYMVEVNFSAKNSFNLRSDSLAYVWFDKEGNVINSVIY